MSKRQLEMLNNLLCGWLKGDVILKCCKPQTIKYSTT